MRWFNQIHGFRYASLRYFNVAGAIEGYGGVPRARVAPDSADSGRCPGPQRPDQDLRDRLPHQGRNLRPRLYPCAATWPTHIGWRSAPSSTKSCMIYNIGNGQGFTVREVIDSVQAGDRPPQVQGGRAAAPAGGSCCARSRLREDQAGAGVVSAACRTLTASSPAPGSGTSIRYSKDVNPALTCRLKDQS